MPKIGFELDVKYNQDIATFFYSVFLENGFYK